MIKGGLFGRKRGRSDDYGKKSSSTFKKGVIAGGLLLAAGAGVYASAGASEHKDGEPSNYPTVGDPAGEGLGHNPALVERAEIVDKPFFKEAAPEPAIKFEDVEKALEPKKLDKKGKIGAGLKLAGEVVGGEKGKLEAVKGGIKIARGQGDNREGHRDLNEMIQEAEKRAKKDKRKINKDTVGVGVVPMIGPVAPPEFFEDEEPKKKSRFSKLNPFHRKG